MTQVVLRLDLLMDPRFFGAVSCELLRANRASDSASEFASPSQCEHLRNRRVPMADDPGPRTARLKVKVVPGSSRNEIVGWLGEALKIKVTAPPERGKANKAVVELLAAALGIATDDVIVVSGHASPSKIVAVSGMDDETIKKGFG